MLFLLLLLLLFIIAHPTAIYYNTNATRWTINRPPSRPHAAVSIYSSHEYIGFNRTSARRAAFSKKPLYCCVRFLRFIIVFFFFFIFWPTLNNRISDILWGGKLIFFSLSSPVIAVHFQTKPPPPRNRKAYTVRDDDDGRWNAMSRWPVAGMEKLHMPVTVECFFLFFKIQFVVEWIPDMYANRNFRWRLWMI